ncbi:hypothetical protein LTR95_014874 [Oleoguttula sp. CCFEE 5521]
MSPFSPAGYGFGGYEDSFTLDPFKETSSGQLTPGEGEWQSLLNDTWDEALNLNNSNHSAVLMPTTTRRHAHRVSSESDPSSTESASGASGVRSEDRDPLESDDNGEHIPATLPGIVRQLSVVQRQMEYNLRNLDDGLRNTNIRSAHLEADTNIRFDHLEADTNRRFDEQRAQLGQLKAHQINRSATRINNLIQPVGHTDGTPVPTELSRRYKYVHEFLRLKRRENWPVLDKLHGFYGSESWSTWGFIPMSSWDESDNEEPLITHHTLEEAISWAPNDALQELARHVGLDYDKNLNNVEEYEGLQQRRAIQNKRIMADELTSSKRGKHVTSERQESHERQEPHEPQADKTKTPASTSGRQKPYESQADETKKPESTLSGELGWASRATRDSQRPRVVDAPEYQQATFLPISVATFDAQLPARTKR